MEQNSQLITNSQVVEDHHLVADSCSTPAWFLQVSPSGSLYGPFAIKAPCVDIVLKAAARVAPAARVAATVRIQ